MRQLFQDLALALAFLALYFLPLIVGALRNVPQRPRMLLANLVFGWSVIGWLAVLFWACTEETAQAAITASPSPPPPSPSAPVLLPHFADEKSGPHVPAALVFLNRVGRMLTGF